MKRGPSRIHRVAWLAICLLVAAVIVAMNWSALGVLTASMWPMIRGVLIAFLGIAVLAAIAAGITVWLRKQRDPYA